MFETTITIQPEEENNTVLIRKKIFAQLKNENKKIQDEKKCILVLKKKSVDSRHGKTKFHLRYEIFDGENPTEYEETEKFCPKWQHVGENAKRCIIVGSGPAGLFAALKLLENGIKPIVLERGSETSKRKIQIANISKNGFVDENSNYCFGEGGAGTFSDGKLYTRSNKRGNIKEVLQIFVYHGADPKILSDSHAHIGTDKLPKIVNNMVATIRAFGGEVHFDTRVTDFLLADEDSLCGAQSCEGGMVRLSAKLDCAFGAEMNKGGMERDLVGANGELGAKLCKALSVRTLRVVGVECEMCGAQSCEGGMVRDPVGANGELGAQLCKAQSVRELATISVLGDYVILATGHSATDIYQKLSKIACISGAKILEEKTFAVGVRVEHPRKIIDRIQYHGRSENLPASEYRLVEQVDGRGVYSFCMCPGGNVVPSQSANGQIVVNGMSCSSRNSNWSNAAIVVEIRPEDARAILIEENVKISDEKPCSLQFREYLERLAFENGQNQKAPSQRLVDFLAGRASVDLPKTSYTPGLVSSRLDLWLPRFISERLKKGFLQFDKKMRGFICDDAVLIACETRTSTPVRILRDKETFESCAIRALYPCGEGSGYSGGIVSSAMDGINAAGKIISLQS